MKSIEIEFQVSRDRKLLEKSVRSVVHRFGAGADGTQFAVVFDVDWKSRPIIVHADLVKRVFV